MKIQLICMTSLCFFPSRDTTRAMERDRVGIEDRINNIIIEPN